MWPMKCLKMLAMLAVGIVLLCNLVAAEAKESSDSVVRVGLPIQGDISYIDENGEYAGSYNVGPEESDCLTTGGLVELFCDKWEKQTGYRPIWTDGKESRGPHEAGYLKLDCSRMRQVFGWKPRWNIEEAVKKTVEWFQVYASGGDVASCMEAQIREFMEEA